MARGSKASSQVTKPDLARGGHKGFALTPARKSYLERRAEKLANALLAHCSVCKAPFGEKCRTFSGSVAGEPHAIRIRRGNELAAKQKEKTDE